MEEEMMEVVDLEHWSPQPVPVHATSACLDACTRFWAWLHACRINAWAWLRCMSEPLPSGSAAVPILPEEPIDEIIDVVPQSAMVAIDDAMLESVPPSTAGVDASEDLADLLKCYGISIHEDRYYGCRRTINMVPMELKRGDENKCYEPVAVQIGLCRSRSESEEFQQLERYKSRCVQQLMNRCKRRRPGLTLDCCYARMEELYHAVLGCHNKGMVGVELDHLARTMLLDGCFILDCLLKFTSPEKKNRRGHARIQAGGRLFVWQLVTRDLLLLENQIPFLVLHELFDRLRNDDDGKDALVKGSLALFRSLCPQMLSCSDTVVSAIADESVEVHHLLHLFYLFVGFHDKSHLRRRDDGGVKRPREEADGDELPLPPAELHPPLWIPGAKELEEAGIRLRKRNKGAPTTTTFLDIKFDIHTGVLEIPPLELYDYSEALFRNMIAFEQTCPGTKFDVSTYAVFMNCLVTTPEDMRILHLHGILTNMINGEQDASRFFDRICSQVHFPSENYLAGVMGDVNKYKNRRRHKWRATLVRDYFSNPWASISVVAAVLLLGMTMLQTFFAVYAYYKPPS